MKTSVFYCNSCGRRTVHTRVHKETYGGGGPGRALLAIASLGMSELTFYEYYECNKCGNLKRKV